MLNALKFAFGRKTILFSILLSILSAQISYAQWVEVSNGMVNRYISSLAFSGNYLFAGTNSYGVYLSTNDGASWTQTSLNNRFVLSIAVNGNNIFAGTGSSYGIYLSTNNGANWTQTSLNNRVVYSLAVNGNNIFAGTWNNGVYISTNNGVSWTQTSLNNKTIRSLAVSGNNIFAGVGETSSDGVYLSTDNGTSWTQTSLNNRAVYSLAVSGNNIFAGTFNPNNGVYLSTNNGANWSQTSLNIQGVDALIINGNNIFAGSPGLGVFVSNNNGTTWTQRNEGLGYLYVYSLCILNNYIFAGTGINVYRRPFGELVDIKPISNEVPNKFSLSQNYPNPFNPVTKIRFAISSNVKGETSNAKLIIFDILGREIETLVNEQLKSGIYEVDWNASNYPSEVYFYRLVVDSYGENGGFVKTKKMILVK